MRVKEKDQKDEKDDKDMKGEGRGDKGPESKNGGKRKG